MDRPEVVGGSLAASSVARKRFEDLPPSHEREYIEWIDQARKPETRASCWDTA